MNEMTTKCIAGARQIAHPGGEGQLHLQEGQKPYSKVPLLEGQLPLLEGSFK